MGPTYFICIECMEFGITGCRILLTDLVIHRAGGNDSLDSTSLCIYSIYRALEMLMFSLLDSSHFICRPCRRHWRESGRWVAATAWCDHPLRVTPRKLCLCSQSVHLPYT